MLFLLNDTILDLGPPKLRLESLVGDRARTLERMSAHEVVQLGRQMFFEAGPGNMPDERSCMTLASLIALKSEADAALFQAPAGAKSAKDVLYRFVSMPITTIHYLAALQEAGTLTRNEINELVWQAAWTRLPSKV